MITKLFMIVVSLIAIGVTIYLFLPKHVTCQYSDFEISELQKRANNGDTDAAWKLYGCFEEDEIMSIHWLKVGASAGDQRAKYNLYSILSSKGQQDSILLLLDAANNNYSLAQRDLAELFINGKYWDKDLTAATYWYRRAARLGDNIAMFDLANLLISLKGSNNKVEACYWVENVSDSIEKNSSIYTDLLKFREKNCK